MSQRPPSDEDRIRRIAQASVWRVRLAEAGCDSSEAFEAWLAADPLNAAAWSEAQAPWVAIGEAATSPELMAARRDALHRARHAGRRRWRGRQTGLKLGLAAAAAAIAVAVVLVGQIGLPWFATDYRTALGERRLVTLSDGSKITLDSSSEVQVAYSRDARRLVLVQGQARFDVAHNPLRPFSVKAGPETVVATGTAFNIDMLGPKVLVTLIEGRVSVIAARPGPHLALTQKAWAPKPRPIVLVAGQQLVVAPSLAPNIQLASLDRTTAWENGQLVFEDEALGSVAARISRYAASPVTVEADAADLKISGVFNSGDVATFVDTVTRYLPVQAGEAPDGSITLKRKS